jgi:alanine racemase
MGRIGMPWREAEKFFRTIQRLPRLKIAGVYTHYSSVESDADFSRKQRDRFETVLRGLRIIKPDLGVVHMNNTGGILWEEASTYNAVRPGLLVYGVIPSDSRPSSADWRRHLKPALTWKARVALVKPVARGTRLSYGGAFIAPRRMSIATLTVGYGDGYLRSGTGLSHVLVHGKLCPVVARITMDQTLIDVSHLRSVRPGDEAVLIGEQGNKSISVNQLADWCGTIPWEILTSIAYRVPRVYRGGTAA